MRKTTTTILGLCFGTHKSSAAIIQEGNLLAAACEEIFSRELGDRRFPEQSIDFCLAKANASPASIDYIIFFDKLFYRLEKVILRTIQNWPKNFFSTMKEVESFISTAIHIRAEVRKKFPTSKLRFCLEEESIASTNQYASLNPSIARSAGAAFFFSEKILHKPCGAISNYQIGPSIKLDLIEDFLHQYKIPYQSISHTIQKDFIEEAKIKNHRIGIYRGALSIFESMADNHYVLENTKKYPFSTKNQPTAHTIQNIMQVFTLKKLDYLLLENFLISRVKN